MLQTIVMCVLAVAAVANIGAVLWTERHRYGFFWHVWSRVRLGMVVSTFCVLTLTIIVALLLMKVPGLHYGWMHLFYSKGGNVMIEPALAGSKSSVGWVRWLPVLFIAVFIFCIPFLARLEEEIFRARRVEWRPILIMSLAFGLIHCVVGIPIAFGLALSLAGLFYAYQYRRAATRFIDGAIKRAATAPISLAEAGEGANEEGLMVATAYHTVWNTIACSILLIGSIVQALR